MNTGLLEVLDLAGVNLVAYFGPTAATAYLREYLNDLNAAVAVHETHYVDRHYLDDFTSYYARSFDVPDAHCRRVHFFEGLNAAQVNAYFDEIYLDGSKRDAAEAHLNEHYLGFVVARPLSAARLGRTVMKTYPADGGRRHYEVIRRYIVNVAGARLFVDGLAYQQQDRGAAVCASTALWSALQRVAYVAGHRTPTPSAISCAARSPYPASKGMSDLQMATALSTLGYIADHFAPLENRPLFRAKVVACLRSHLPVILLIAKKVPTGAGEVWVGHAVTVTGYSEPPAIVDVPMPAPKQRPIPMRAGSLDVVYVHDDNLGWHAHYELFDAGKLTTSDEHEPLMLYRGRRGKPPRPPGWAPDEWSVLGALVPKPDKLRLPVESLIASIGEARVLFERALPSVTLNYAARFALGAEYKRQLIDLGIDRSQLRGFVERMSMPRHIGVISAYRGDEHLIDALIDVTEVQRSLSRPSFLAFVAPGVPVMSQGTLHLRQFESTFGTPVITGL